jgi:hypothetical protein
MRSFEYAAMRDELLKIAGIGRLINNMPGEFPTDDDDSPNRQDRLQDQPIITTTTSEPGEKTPQLYPDARTAP